MNNIIIIILIVIAGFCAFTHAEDSIITLGMEFSGENEHTISITSGDALSHSNPGLAGPRTYTLTGGPVTMELGDNNYTCGGVTRTFLKARISSTLPSQYGASPATYRLRLVPPTWTPLADNTITTVGRFPALFLSGTDAGIYTTTGSAIGGILHGTSTQDINLVINSNKRLYGDTSDTIIITYTFFDF